MQRLNISVEKADNGYIVHGSWSNRESTPPIDGTLRLVAGSEGDVLKHISTIANSAMNNPAKPQA